MTTLDYTDWRKLDVLELSAAQKTRAAWVRAQLAALPRYSDSPALYHAAIEALRQRIMNQAEPGTRLTVRWDGASAAMLGIRSTSTSGLAKALSNWCGRVEGRK